MKNRTIQSLHLTQFPLLILTLYLTTIQENYRPESGAEDFLYEPELLPKTFQTE